MRPSPLRRRSALNHRRCRSIVLGCQARVSFRGKTPAEAVVGDIGPRLGLGELSVACAKALDIPDSPISGGGRRGCPTKSYLGNRLW